MILKKEKISKVLTQKVIFGIALSALFLLIAPIYLNSYLKHVFIMIFLNAYLGGCWNILGGFAGQFSFGHALFFGLGAYTSTLLFIKFGITPWIGLFIGGLLGMTVGLFIGYLSFRYGLKGYFFALVMLGFSEVVRVIALNINLTQGARGILIPLKGNAPYLFQFSEKIYYYYIAFLLMIIMVIVCYSIKGSRLGYFLNCIREDEIAASSLGINTFKFKMIAMGISSFFTSIGGTFYAQYMLFIDPDLTFGVQISVEILLQPIIGGIGTIFGPIFGSFFLAPVTEITRSLLQAYSGAYLFFYGIILIIVVLFLPNGIMGGLHSFYNRFLYKEEI
jgi:branched-chain amino acid transport system permease protein